MCLVDTFLPFIERKPIASSMSDLFAHHGSVSSASTGKLAALLLPLEVLLEEN